MGITLLLLSSCKKFQDIRFGGIEEVKLNKMSVNESTLEMNLAFYNPNNFGAVLNTAGGKAWIQNIYLGDFLSNGEVKIPAKSNFSVPVQVSVNMKELLHHSLSLMLLDSLTLKVEGGATLTKGSIFKTLPLRYNTKRSAADLLSNLKL